MPTIRLNKSLIISIVAALLLGWLTASSGIAGDSHYPEVINPPPETDQVTPTLGVYPTNTVTPTPEPTNAFNLPMVQQEAPYHTPEPTLPGKQGPPPTITPTPIPLQGPEENAPIVFGAMVIVLIIILAWLVVGRRK